ncbi:MAG: family 10 glycosylhydrolase, partial [Cyanobacteriota bacterium]|nr:family 10 glycosylhydrolase [Cyanobacteriota bacterium]
MPSKRLRTVVAGVITTILPLLATAQLAARAQTLPPLPPLPQPPAAAGNRRLGVWLTNSPSPLYYEADRIEKSVAELARAGFNTLYPNVWSRGTTFHRSRFAPMEPALERRNPNLDPICRLTAAAHRRGLEVIPWFEYGLMEPADAAVVQQHPEWVLQRLDGSSVMEMHGSPMVWLNPAHPGVQARFLGLIGEIVQRCGVDGIQLDDHFAWPVELGYDPFTRDLYRAETGREPPDDHTERSWMRWRRHR